MAGSLSFRPLDVGGLGILFLTYLFVLRWASQVVLVVKNLPANAGDSSCVKHGFDSWIGKILLEQEMATHSSILAWKIPWTEEPDRYEVAKSQACLSV